MMATPSENIDRAIDIAFRAAEGAEAGNVETGVGDVMVRGAYAVVKGEEVRVNGALSAARA